jgi:hypothetical protein
MSTQSYTSSTGLTYFNGDVFPANTWIVNGAGLNTTDAQYLFHDNSSPVTSFVAISQVNDNTIPVSSTVSAINTTYRTSLNNDISIYSVAPYMRYSPGSNTFGAAFVYGSVGTPVNTAVNWTTDPNGAAWTVANFYLARFGVFVDQSITSGTPVWYRLDRTVVFTLPSPAVVTTAATSVTVSSATLNGTVNPSGATSTYPVQYRFEYGPTTSYGTQTTLTGPLTGSSTGAVSANISGLTGFSTYHYRLIASNADVTINGSDLTFSTGVTDRAMMVF